MFTTFTLTAGLRPCPAARRALAAALGLTALAAGATAEAADAAAQLRPYTPTTIRPKAVAAPTDAKAAAGVVTPLAQTLSAPVTVTANTTADALTVRQTGAARAINGVVNRPSSGFAAVRGEHNGLGSGIYGINTGTTGPAARFDITRSTTAQPAVLAVNAGLGNAVQAIVTSTAAEDTPAVLGQHVLGPRVYGVGVQGEGNYIGARGIGRDGGLAGIVGAANGALYGGYFSGNVFAENNLSVLGSVTAATYALASDRNLKAGFEPIDGNEVLDKIAAMPISAWHYKSSEGERHIGPMAQDFHAAFGLGKDDRHIEVVDLGGVSLAAVQALKRQVDAKDARIAQLESQLASLNATIDGRLAALEQAAQVAATTVPTAAAAPDLR